MKPGTRSRPTVIKQLTGEKNKNRINKNEPKPKADIPTIPSWLDAYARKVWRYHAAELHRIGILTVADRDSFAAYCQAVSDLKASTEMVSNEGLIVESSQGPKANPAVAIKQKAMQTVRHYANEFGLTPSSRAGLSVKPISKSDKKKGKLKLIG